MRFAMLLLAGLLAVGVVGTTTTATAKKSGSQSSNKDDSSGIKKGMSLSDAEQIAGAKATAVGAPNNGIQTYRLTMRQLPADAPANAHPTITFYMMGVNGSGVITWVHKQG